jgi:hypothetical protein
VGLGDTGPDGITGRLVELLGIEWRTGADPDPGEPLEVRDILGVERATQRQERVGEADEPLVA